MAQVSIQQAFRTAVQFHQAGQLSQAETLYKEIVAQQPNHPDALHYLGVIASQSGRHDAAVELIRKAIALKPNYANAHGNLGLALRENGQLDEAIAAYRQAIVLNPNYADAYNGLGAALRDKDQIDEAIAAFRHALALKPDFAEAHYNLGSAFRAAWRYDDAIASCRRAIALDPKYAEAFCTLGNALRDKGQLAEAIAAFNQAIALRPKYPEAYNNLGNALKDKRQLDDAIAAYDQAIALKPAFAVAHNNLGVALNEKGNREQAVGAYRKSIALQPDHAEAHYNLALELLARGELVEGWEEHEWRWKCRDFGPLRRDLMQPLWDGRSLPEATILLYAEQGLGDTLQFSRYVQLAARRCRRVVIECQAELRRLFQMMPGAGDVVVRGETLPALDVQCPLLSLPRVFATTLTSIPHDVPYLHADVEASGRWRKKLEADTNSIKVGLVWAGNKAHTNDRNRSMALSAFAPLGRSDGASFYTLQKGEQAVQARTPPAGLQLIDWTDDLKDFADTAALIANLDVVISVDTAVAHLAGAMAKPVWVLLPLSADWRWLRDRDDSPWYPTMRLFRQANAGNWDDVMLRVRESLVELVP